MGQEVEKKWIVTMPTTLEEFQELSDISYSELMIDLYIGPLRIRFEDSFVRLTHKAGSGAIREENELLIDGGASKEEILEFAKKLPPSMCVRGEKTRYYVYPSEIEDMIEVSWGVDKTDINSLQITFDDYDVHGELLVFILEIESYKEDSQEATALIDAALVALKEILPKGTHFLEVTGQEQYSNRTLLQDSTNLRLCGHKWHAL